MEKSCFNASIIAEFLENQKNVKEVIYPGLKSHKQHEIAKKQMRAFGAIVSFRIKGGKEETVKFSQSLKSILIAESLGATKTYINVPSLMTHMSVPPD